MEKKEVQKHAIEALDKVYRGTAAISMGVGKTLLGLQHMHEEWKKGMGKFMVVAPKVSVFETWKEEAKKFGYEPLIALTTFTTYRSLTKQSSDYDCIYLDECHSLLYSHENYLSFYFGKIVGFTGTPPRNKSSEKGFMVNKYCPIVYTYIVDEAVGHKILNDYRITVHLLSLSSARTHKVKKADGGYWHTSERDHYDFWTKKIDGTFGFNKDKLRILRMKGIMEYGTKERFAKFLLQHIDDQCIVFCNTTEQADRICSNSYHSKNKNSLENLENFKNKVFKCLSAVEQLNEGINIPGLKYGIIMHSYSNERKASQRIGRLLRLNPNDTAYLHLFVYKNTIDEEWAKSALSDFDQSKISYRDAEYNN